MEMNPIMERIIRLSEQWKTEVGDNPDIKAFCWLGNSMTEYQMIRGFALFHMSEESTLDDVFIACHLPFNSETAEHYGVKTLETMDAYVNSWNKDEKLSVEHGKINWSVVFDDSKSDAFNFAINMNGLAKSLSCDGKGKKLVVCILPQRLDDLEGFKEWVVQLLKSPVEPSVCYMLYDTYESRLFGKIEKGYLHSFKYLIPDMDLYGAINQIMEDKKNESADSESRDVIGFQQLLLKLTEASGKGDEKKTNEIARQALDTIKNYDMPQMEALIYYLLYGFYASNGNKDKASENIDKAIEKSEQAVEKDIPGSRMTYCQYLVSKANTYFFNKKHSKALPIYMEALSASKKDCALEMQISIYQIIGTCKRMCGDYDSWDFFYEGWKLIETLNEQQIKAQLPLRYYAMEMLKSGGNKENYKFENRFVSLWGENWKEDLKKMEKEQKKRASALK